MDIQEGIITSSLTEMQKQKILEQSRCSDVLLTVYNGYFGDRETDCIVYDPAAAVKIARSFKNCSCYENR